jgi:hypothetical protein
VRSDQSQRADDGLVAAGSRSARCPHLRSYPAIFALLILAILTATLSSRAADAPAPARLGADTLNLVFIRSADVDAATGDLSIKGLNRSLMMGSYLRSLLGGQSVSEIHALIPTSHPVGPGRIPDLAPLETVQQFDLLSQHAIGYAGATLPIKVDIDYRNTLAAIHRMIAGRSIGNFFFSMPPAMLPALLRGIMQAEHWSTGITEIPADGYNLVYVLSIPPGGKPVIQVVDAAIEPPDAYPNLNLRGGNACLQRPYTLSTEGAPAYSVPDGINTDETLYFVRHVEAHPDGFEDGNYVCRGQWRAIGATGILFAKIGGRPDYVYSSDPAEIKEGFSYVRPALSLSPFAIQNDLPLNLAARDGSSIASNDAGKVAAFFFFGGRFSGKTLLVGWGHTGIETAVADLVSRYGPVPRDLPLWNEDDYDTIYKVQLDVSGNLTFSNSCEGILTSSLPHACPTLRPR